MDDIEGVGYVIANQDKFIKKLGIRKDAYPSLFEKQFVGKRVDILKMAVAGAAGAEVGAIAGGVIAGAEILAVLGIAAATPIGWVIAPGVAAAAGVFVVGQYLNRGSVRINTSLDALAVVWFDFFVPLGLKVAALDGRISDPERQCIKEYFVQEWGYSEQFVQFALPELECDIKTFPIVELVDKMIELKTRYPDLNYGVMSKELTGFLQTVTRADGELHDLEVIFVQWLEIALTNGEPGFWDRLVGAVGFKQRPKNKANDECEPVSDSATVEDEPRDGEQEGFVGRNVRNALHWARGQF